MENFFVALNAVLPMFLMIGVGCVARRMKIIGDAAVRQANSLCFRVFMSTMMFYNVYTSELGRAFNGKMVLFCLLGIFAEFGLGALLIARIEKKPPVRGVMLQAFFRTNVVLLGIPIAASIFGREQIGEITILTAIVVPTINILSVVALEMFRGGKVDVPHMLISIAKNPLVWGVLIGLAVALPGIRLPLVVESAVSSMASAATPMALVLLGASLNFSKFGSETRNVAVCLAERLLISPAVFIGLAVALGFRGVPLVGIMLVFAAPVAVASFTVAVELGGDADLAGELVLLTTGLSCFTLFAWIFFLRTVGLI